MISKLLAFLIPGASAIYGFGSCANQPVCKPDNHYTELGRILGSWYVTDLDRIEHITTLNFQCNLYDYSLNGDVYTEKLMTNIFQMPLDDKSITTEDAPLRAKMVYTDYDNFLVRWECEDILDGIIHARKATLMSRTEKLSETYRDKAKAFLKDKCNYNANFLLNEQWAFGCQFDTEDVEEAPPPPPPTTCPPDDKSEWSSGSTPTRVQDFIPILLSGRLKLQWTAPRESQTPIERYYIEFMDSSGGYRELKGCLGCWSRIVSDLNCEISLSQLYDVPMALAEGDSVQIRVKALNSAGYSDFTYSSSIVLPKKTPTFTSPIKVFGASSKIYIEWAKPEQVGYADVTKYEIRTNNCGGPFTLDAHEESFIIGGLPDNKLCDISFSAFNSAGESDRHEVEVRASITRGYVSPATAKVVREAGVNKIELSWPLPGSQKELTGFEVFFKAKSSGGLMQLPSCIVEKRSGVLPTSCKVLFDDIISAGLASNDGGEWSIIAKVKAITAVDDFISSSEATIIPEMDPTPVDMVVSSGTWSSMTFTCGQADISWFKYELVKVSGTYCNIPSQADWANGVVIGAEQTTQTFTVSSDLDEHFIACRAVASNKKGPIESFYYMNKVGDDAPEVAQNFKITSQTTTSLAVQWDAPSNNGNDPYLWVTSLSKFDNNGCNQIMGSRSHTSPWTYHLPLVPDTTYGVLVDYTNLLGSFHWSVLVYYFKA